MDFSKLLSKLSDIEGKTQLNEAAEKTDKPWTDMSGKKHSGTAVKGDKYTGKEAEKDDKSKKVDEAAKPDFLDMDKDGDKKEPMKKAVDDKKKKGVKESTLAELIARMDAIIESAEKVEEDDVEEGNEFSGELAKAKAAGKKDFEVDGKKYQVKEAEDRPASKEKETSWTDKEGKKHTGKQVQGWQSVKGDKEADKEKKATMKESQLDECGDIMGQMGQQQPESGMNVNTSIDTRTGRKTVSISADGESADQLMQILKLSGMGGSHAMGDVDGDGDHDMADHAQEMGGGEVQVELVPLAHAEGGFKGGDEEVEETYANDPNPQTQGVDAQLRQGTDLNKEKTMHKHNYRGGDNPMAMKEAKELELLEAELMEELDSIKVKAPGTKYGNSFKAPTMVKKVK
jgi:hypothetical protein